MRWIKHKKKSAAALTAMLLVTTGIYFFLRHRNNLKGSSESIATVARQDIELRFRETGEIRPKVAVDVRSKVSGRILKLYVQEGDTVRQGSKLALLQPGRSELDKYVPIEITAPIDGVVYAALSNSNGNNEQANFPQPGDYATGLFESNNATALMTIADPRQMAVELKINEMDILKIKDRLAVEVSVDAITMETFTGVIGSIAPRAVKDTSNLKAFRVIVELNKHDPRLRAGMTARVEAVLEKRTKTLAIPINAVYEESGEEFVYLATKDESVKTKIKTGLKNEIDTEVLTGLKEGDKVYQEKPPEKS